MVLFFHIYTPFSYITSTHVVFYQIVDHSKLLHLAEVSLSKFLKDMLYICPTQRVVYLWALRKGLKVSQKEELALGGLHQDKLVGLPLA